MQIEQRFWSSWDLPSDTTEETADRVFRTLDDQLRRRFGSTLQPTPGRTGLLAWRRLQESRKGAVGGVWPTLPPDLRAIIRETSGQGRFECCPVPEKVWVSNREQRESIPDLYCLDMQLAYAAGAIHMQAGKEWRHDVGPGSRRYTLEEAHAPGWYRVQFEVPADWRHVGILPVHVPGTAGGWRWPTFSLPNVGRLGVPLKEHVTPFETWASHHEVALAVECGWRVEILERIVAVVPDGASSFLCPLRLWAGKLIEMRKEALATAPLLAAPIRNILLHTVGSFARGPQKVTRTVSQAGPTPDHELARSTMRPIFGGRKTAGGSMLTEITGWEYEDYAPGGGDEEYQHPEWSALIWGWTRARLLRGSHCIDGRPWPVGALSLPREQVVGFALDCIYTTQDPGWPVSTATRARDIPLGPGDYRVKRHVPGPLPVPRTMLDLYKLTGEVAE